MGTILSLDVHLTDAEGQAVFSANITHNMGAMAREAGIYECLWRPDEHGITRAGDLIEPVATGLALMASEPKRFKALDPTNKWGSWKAFVPWIAEYLEALRAWPESTVRVCR